MLIIIINYLSNFYGVYLLACYPLFQSEEYQDYSAKMYAKVRLMHVYQLPMQ